MNRRFEAFLALLGRMGHLAEDGLLIGLLSVMIGLAALQIFLRNVLDTGFVWADELLRIQVLWLGLLGAIAASRDNNHINIDVLTRFLPQRMRLVARILTDLFTAAICGTVAWYAMGFVQIEREFGSMALGMFPAWIFQSIIPVGFAIIAYRYVVYFFSHLRQFLMGAASP
jgi:TRAP-type C4-dicarboxylate transport system permease small subunit